MPSTRAAGGGCLFRALRACAILIFVCVAIGEVAAHALASRSVKRTQDAWAAEVESFQALRARLPTRPDSPAALRLDDLTEPLGIRMVRRQGASPLDPTRTTERVLGALGAAVAKLSRSTGGVPPPLPAGAEALLRREDARLGAIVHHILEGGSLQWEQDLSQGLGAPVPQLLGHRQLQSLLLARSWVATRDGRPTDAALALEASWQLNASLLPHPQLITQLICLAVGEMQHEVLRLIPGPASAWLSRMRERPFSSGFANALQFEAVSWMHLADGSWGVFDIGHIEDARSPARGPLGRFGRFLTSPYIQLSMADTSDALLRARRDLERQRRCDLDIDAYAKRFEGSFPAWNSVGRKATPSFIKAWLALREGDFDRELTERTLLARAERAASGAWPTASFPSAVCEGVSWESRTMPDGGLTISASAKPFDLENPRWTWDLRLRP